MSTEYDRLHDQLISLGESMAASSRDLHHKMDKVISSVADQGKSVAALEAWKTGRDQEAQRFWTTTWPAQLQLNQALDDRMRALEREKAAVAKLDELTAVLRTTATKDHLNDVATKLDELAKEVKADNGELVGRVSKLEIAKATDNRAFGIYISIGLFVVYFLVDWLKSYVFKV